MTTPTNVKTPAQTAYDLAHTEHGQTGHRLLRAAQAVLNERIVLAFPTVAWATLTGQYGDMTGELTVTITRVILADGTVIDTDEQHSELIEALNSDALSQLIDLADIPGEDYAGITNTEFPTGF